MFMLYLQVKGQGQTRDIEFVKTKALIYCAQANGAKLHGCPLITSATYRPYSHRNSELPSAASRLEQDKISSWMRMHHQRRPESWSTLEMRHVGIGGHFTKIVLPATVTVADLAYVNFAPDMTAPTAWAPENGF
ncbi:uncharacterized protein PpBr36_11304 [Pyricularia pennisetigena]|uniref:uncharacterized protein n=1 Tax=Pyricularia pennisetigena TaxID=1578925 RepID=UPI00114D894F|nr:uncharacterized protein PpBr36_11304 [Pyricularia pennisetigena]TLS20573.1 hypothetical protein PpBr36_11304 [Pyricularia pennisetigena]